MAPTASPGLPLRSTCAAGIAFGDLRHRGHAEIGDDALTWPVLRQARQLRRCCATRPTVTTSPPGTSPPPRQAGQRDHHRALRRGRLDVRR
ncbi:hypothetical protein HBB16_07535 [Pseudonocardia sp. MCCB 268]|nr:hypothetical protein [Pseudonocardia cytotoxica]